MGIQVGDFVAFDALPEISDAGFINARHLDDKAGVAILLTVAKALKEGLLDRALATWPGPVTWLFPRAPDVPDWLAGSHATIALRVTAHPVCRALCSSFGSAIVSTSANPRSDPPARSAAQVARYFGDALGGIVEGELGSDPRPSEIRDLASGRVIRAG